MTELSQVVVKLMEEVEDRCTQCHMSFVPLDDIERLCLLAQQEGYRMGLEEGWTKGTKPFLVRPRN